MEIQAHAYKKESFDDQRGVEILPLWLLPGREPSAQLQGKGWYSNVVGLIWYVGFVVVSV